MFVLVTVVKMQSFIISRTRCCGFSYIFATVLYETIYAKGTLILYSILSRYVRHPPKEGRNNNKIKVMVCIFLFYIVLDASDNWL